MTREKARKLAEELVGRMTVEEMASQLRFDAPEGFDLSAGQLVLANYESNFFIMNGFTSRPYEMRVYYFE